MTIQKKIKKNALKTFKKNYWRCLAVVFFVNLCIGTFTIISPNHSYNQIPFLNSFNSDIATEFLESITNIQIDLSFYKPTRGILANLFNNVTTSGSFIFGLLNSLNQLLFHEHIWASIIIFLGAILTFLYWLFIRQALIVGENRFFLENKNHAHTHFKRIFLPFKIKELKNLCFVMAKKTIYEWFWWLTLIGGIINHYAYALIPYILAENPGIKSNDAIKLSKDLMKGQKWNLFKLDLSFLIWYILDFLSFHLIGIIYVIPYKKCCLANFYFQVRALGQEKNIPNIQLLSDKYLLEISDIYPEEKFLYKVKHKKNNLNINYNENYSVSSLILIFFVTSIIGWCWEVGFHLFQYGTFVNRGVLHGPWLPIYGWGIILLLVTLKKYRQDPFKTFILAMVICGTVEFGTSYYLEISKNTSWWDYEGYFLNIQGRICLEGLIAFGLAGCMFIYFVAPFLNSIFIKINQKLKIVICIILVLLYIIDNAYSTVIPNKGSGISKELKISETSLTFRI